ncbi:peptidase family M1-domain-containing protein [Gamsiella multidivaricata]|uniref:peptidase family M1-domain-containing protein n=1 Tax=Gamsiella multidivaricata TaxID=101098 RepID=UPI00221ED7E7|nr:peptidase family M1-domain-containing protein [Gamsiella multidivaricata]KAI7832592.1 peptidase family M1-domain-containing protein [Gamsiella multidivaricata]
MCNKPGNPNRVVLPTNVTPSHYTLTITPDLEKYTFRGYVEINITIHEATKTIQINTKELTTSWVNVEIDGKTHDAAETTFDEHRETTTFTFESELPKGSAVLSMHFDGILNDKMAGFYRSSYKDTEGNAKVMGVTQFEATEARRAFPCWDEPSAKATFSIKLVIPVDLVALSNMPVESVTMVEPEEKTVHFEKTPIMSTYLVAWAVGDFEYVESTTTKLENPVTCRVYTLPGLKEQGRFAVEITPKILEYFSEIFGTAYPLPKMDQIAVPDFDMGAMENWGLVTYRTVALLFDEKTSDLRFKEQVASIVAHELAHQWFGNLVTMEWWDHLWLNEGFATWVGTLAVDHLFPEWDTWSSFVVNDVQRGIALDSLRSSHPIEVPVNDPHEIHQIFDAISYSKGASVIRMLSNWLTLDVFLAGIRRYLKKHEYQNATTDDLWAALSEESKIDVGEFMGTWTRVIGLPILDVSESDGVVSVEQHRYLSTNDVKPEEDETIWWVPLGVYPKPESIADPNQTLKTRSLKFEVPEGPYLLNKNFSGVFRTNYPPSAIARIGQAILNGSDLVSLSDRAGLVADISSLAKSGHTATKNFLDLVQYYKNEDTYIVWELLAQRVGEIASVFADDERIYQGINHFQRNLIDGMVQKLGWEYPDGEDYLTSRLRNVILRTAGRAGHEATVAEAKRRFAIFVSDPSQDGILHPSIRQTAFEIVLSKGGEEELNHVLKYFRSAPKQDQQVVALLALGHVQKPELIAKVQALAISEEVRSQDIMYVLNGLSVNPKARLSTWEFVKAKWPLLEERYKSSMGLLGACVKAPLSQVSDSSLVKDVTEFFVDKDTKSFQRALDQAIESLNVNSAWVAREHEGLTAWLTAKNY